MDSAPIPEAGQASLTGTGKPVTPIWSPLKIKVFRALFLASVASNIGTWMHDISAAWLMTSLAPSPLMVALVQAAATFPLFLFILPAGALADILNRRHMLLLTHLWMILAALALSILTYLGATSPVTLLLCIFALAIGVAFTNPAWQAIIPDIVPRNEIPSAIALGSIGFNLARSVGPALGGLLVASLGPAFVFLLNSISYVGIAIVLYGWKTEKPESALPPDSIFNAIRVGFRHVIYSRGMVAVLIKGGAFILGASAMWAVLPLYVKQDLHLSSLHYGMLIGALGLGAVFGGTALSRLRSKFSVDRVVNRLLIVYALFTLALAYFTNFYVLCLLMFIGGIAWMIMLSSYNIASQLSLPAWVRARGLSLYTMVFFGGLSIGSALWGLLAEYTGIPLTLVISAAVLLLGLLFSRRFNLAYSETINLTVSKHWPTPQVIEEPEPDEGPVVINVEYRINPTDKKDFLFAMKELFISRKRTGAYRWALYNDLSDPDKYIESFILPSWIEHMRQFERLTEHEKEIEEKVSRFHIGNDPPKVKHLLFIKDY